MILFVEPTVKSNGGYKKYYIPVRHDKTRQKNDCFSVRAMQPKVRPYTCNGLLSKQNQRMAPKNTYYIIMACHSVLLMEMPLG